MNQKAPKKVALVTGGGRGIGQAIVEELSRRGFIVVFNQRSVPAGVNESRVKKTAKGELLLLRKGVYWAQVDVAKESEVQAFADRIGKKFGRLDAVINNAGIIDTSKDETLETLDEENFRDSMTTNFFGSVSVTRHCLPWLRKSGSAKVLYVLSSLTFTGSKRRFSYVTSKSALLGLVRALAIELSPDILVNGVVPGYIQTRMAKFTKEELANRLSRIPRGRLGTPEEVAKIVGFLASDDNTYITGQCLHIDGGLYMA